MKRNFKKIIGIMAIWIIVAMFCSNLFFVNGGYEWESPATYDLEEGDLSEFDSYNGGAHIYADAGAAHDGSYGLQVYCDNVAHSGGVNHAYAWDQYAFTAEKYYNLSAWIYLENFAHNYPIAGPKFTLLFCGTTNTFSGSGIAIAIEDVGGVLTLGVFDMNYWGRNMTLPISTILNEWHYFSLVFKAEDSSMAYVYMDGEIISQRVLSPIGDIADGTKYVGVGCDVSSLGSTYYYTSIAKFDEITLQEGTYSESVPDETAPTGGFITYDTWYSGASCKFISVWNDHTELADDNETGIDQALFSYQINGGAWTNKTWVDPYSLAPDGLSGHFKDTLLLGVSGTLYSYRWYGRDLAGNVGVSDVYSFSVEPLNSLLRNSRFETSNDYNVSDAWTHDVAFWDTDGHNNYGLFGPFTYVEMFPSPPNIPIPWAGLDGGPFSSRSPPFGGVLPFTFDGDTDDPPDIYGGIDGGMGGAQTANGTTVWQSWTYDVPRDELYRIFVDGYNYNSTLVVRLNESLDVNITDLDANYLQSYLSGSFNAIRLTGYSNTENYTRIVVEQIAVLVDSAPEVNATNPHGGANALRFKQYEETSAEQELIYPCEKDYIGENTVWAKVSYSNASLPYQLKFKLTYDDASFEYVYRNAASYDVWTRYDLKNETDAGKALSAVAFINSGSTRNIVEIDDWNLIYSPPASAPAADRSLYFRSDEYTTEDSSGYGLDADFWNEAVTLSYNQSGYVSAAMGFRVFLCSSESSKVELTDGSPDGVILISSNATIGFQSGTWTCPQKSVTLGWQYFIVKAYVSFNGGGSWTSAADFVSPYLITETIQNSEWTFTPYVEYAYYEGADVTSFSFKFGNYEYKSHISGVGWTTPRQSKVQMWRQSRGDYAGLVIGAYYDLIGPAVYALITLALAGSMYSRYQHMGTIVFAYTVMGGSGGLLWFLVPPEGAIIIGAVILLGGSALVWRVIR